MKKIAALTMARNDDFYLKKWVEYYGAQLGKENLYIYLDGLDQVVGPFCEGTHAQAVEKIGSQLVAAEKGRLKFLSDKAADLLANGYDLVIGVDADEFVVVDCGCGKAYLTLALYFYLTQTLKFPKVRVIGVDRRADVIAAAQKMAQQLDVSDQVQFVTSELSAFDSEHSTPDMVISLHACDTATDEALARGVEWGSRYIVSAPCCQHELQKVIGPQSDAAFAGVLRHGILRERLCDILTDAFRAMILRVLGYRTQVVEFVSPDATARNILLRAELGARGGQSGAVSDYLNLRDYWHVTPWLQTRLADRLEPHLRRFP